MGPPGTPLVSAAGNQAHSYSVGQESTSACGRHAGCDGCRIGFHVFENRGPHEEVPQVGLQVAHDLFRQIVVEVTLRTRQRIDEDANLGRRPTIDGRLDQLERSSPALSPELEVMEDVRFEAVMV